MLSVLEVQGLCKNYESFFLDNVSFSLRQGKITGFIGRNGAGKTTTLKSLLNMVHPDRGSIHFFDKDFAKNEREIKERIGFLSGGTSFYSNKRISSISKVTAGFYRNWDEALYKNYLKLFSLDEGKTPAQLSNGMKVKYALTLALSHHAELFILDEPTSGLDPVSRDELIEIFLNLCDDGVTILFSTHITSDLDKCADDIIFIKDGQILATGELSNFVRSYKTVNFTDGQLEPAAKNLLIGCKRAKEGFTALVRTEDAAKIGVPVGDADLESIMVDLGRAETV